MDEILVTVSGVSHYYGTAPIKDGAVLKLTKDTENMFDANAISVSLPALGKVGYIANSSHTMAEGTKSASEIYNLFDDEIYCLVTFKTVNRIVCKLLF